MTLFDLICALETIEDKRLPVYTVDAITLRRTGTIGTPNSWRGAYSELAFAPFGEEATVAVAEAIETAKSSIGKTFQGYKGGDFTMQETSFVYSAEWGDVGNAILGVRECPDCVEVIVVDYYSMPN